MPEDAGDRITVKAKLNYRKFAWWNTQWAFAGVRDPAQGAYSLEPGHDDGRWVFTGDTSKVSGRDQGVSLTSRPRLWPKHRRPSRWRHAAPRCRTRSRSPDQPVRERWNDYGIGLLLQGDIRKAEAAFLKVDGDGSGLRRWLGQRGARADSGRRHGRGARSMLRQALDIDPELAKTHFFLAIALKARGEYDEALRHLRPRQAQYPRDRVVLNQLGRVHFLKRQFGEAVEAFTRVLTIDPEDLQAHYNLMLCHQGLGDAEAAARERGLYERFKADESSQAITGPYRQLHPGRQQRAAVDPRAPPSGRAATAGRARDEHTGTPTVSN